jgi:hypothetical protein
MGHQEGSKENLAEILEKFQTDLNSIQWLM